MAMTRIRAGRLFDGTGSPAIVDGAILIDGERIVEVGPAAAVPTPDGAVLLDFPDQTLLPGLVVKACLELDLAGRIGLMEASVRLQRSTPLEWSASARLD